MEGPYILSLDIGTTGCKSILFTIKGEVVDHAWATYPTMHPKVTWAEIPPKSVWQAIVETSKRLLAKSKINPREIKVITADSLMPSWLGIDRKGEPIYNIIFYADQRDIKYYKKIEKSSDKLELYNITGCVNYPGFFPKLIWFKKERERLYNKARWFTPACKDWILHKLCNFTSQFQFSTDWCSASLSNLLDVRKRKWSDKALDIYSANLYDVGDIYSKLPEVLPPYEVIGELDKDVARRTGLAKGTLVVAGDYDTAAFAVGSGAIAEDVASQGLGGASNIILAINEPKIDPKARMLVSCHQLPNKWYLIGPEQTFGSILKWFKDNFCEKEKMLAETKHMDVYKIIDSEAKLSPPGARNLIILPHFAGEMSPYWNPNLRGVLFGLTLRHTKADLARAIMEGTQLHMRLIVEHIEKHLGATINAINVVGGASKSDLWRQITADIMMKTIRWPEIEEATGFGSAITAGFGTGIYDDLIKAASNLVKIKEVRKPIMEHSKKYETVFNIFRRMMPAFNKIFVELASMED